MRVNGKPLSALGQQEAVPKQGLKPDNPLNVIFGPSDPVGSFLCHRSSLRPKGGSFGPVLTSPRE